MKNEKASSNWYMSFSDLIIILLTFFILRYTLFEKHSALTNNAHALKKEISNNEYTNKNSSINSNNFLFLNSLNLFQSYARISINDSLFEKNSSDLHFQGLVKLNAFATTYFEPNKTIIIVDLLNKNENSDLQNKRLLGVTRQVIDKNKHLSPILMLESEAFFEKKDKFLSKTCTDCSRIEIIIGEVKNNHFLDYLDILKDL